jgi:hypothetical protein
MKKVFVIFWAVFTMTTFSFGQKTDKILEEGKLLYRLERASWYGTDVFLEKCAHKIDIAGGYLSYLNENNQVVNIFFEKDNPFRILVRFEFGNMPQENPAKIDTINQLATQQEMDLITIRKDAIRQVSENNDDFFTFYENTSLNFIPLVRNGKKQVFILTGSQVSNVVNIGNDYLLIYNKKNKLTKKEKLHNTLLRFQGKSGDPENPINSTYHSHVLSDIITSTDICTLLLYKDLVEWKQHYVISKKYVSIFDLEKEELVVLARKAWDKIAGFQRNKQ